MKFLYKLVERPDVFYCKKTDKWLSGNELVRLRLDDFGEFLVQVQVHETLTCLFGENRRSLKTEIFAPIIDGFIDEIPK